MAVVTRDQVADFFINFTHEVGDPITNLRLQKLVYYAQAWYLAIYGERLIDDQFEAWVHGPVCPALYRRFRDYRWNPITEEVPAPVLPPKVSEHLEEIMDVYGSYSAWDLERLTHAERPWLSARGDLAPDEPAAEAISEDEMREFYASRIAA